MPTLDPAEIAAQPQNRLIALEDIAAGQALYRRLSDGKAGLAQADNTAERAACIGIATCDAAAGQPVHFISEGIVPVGTTHSFAGHIYILDDVPGQITEYSGDSGGTSEPDVGWYITIVAFGLPSNYLQIRPYITGQQWTT